MRRLLAPALAIAIGIAVSGCGAADLTAQTAPTVIPAPGKTTTTTPAAVAWTVQLAETQATQLAMAEQRYATCYTDAALEQGLLQDAAPEDGTVAQSCSTAGLTPTEVREIQDLLVRASQA